MQVTSPQEQGGTQEVRCLPCPSMLPSPVGTANPSPWSEIKRAYKWDPVSLHGASQVALVVKNPPDNIGDMRSCFDPWVRKTRWRGAWKATPVFSPGVSHGQRSLAGYSWEGCRVGHDWSDWACAQVPPCWTQAASVSTVLTWASFRLSWSSGHSFNN